MKLIPRERQLFLPCINRYWAQQIFLHSTAEIFFLEFKYDCGKPNDVPGQLTFGWD